MPAAPTSQHGRTIESPVGPLVLTASAHGLTRVYFAPEPDAPVEPAHEPAHEPAAERDADSVPALAVDAAASDVLDLAERELDAYFAGSTTSFDVPLDLTGTTFQQQVWALLRQIPYGTTSSYGALARKLGSPGASRAVGLANNKNPVAIIVPCHRVVGADGSLTGYAGGLDRKRQLLDLESGVNALL